MEEWIPFSWFNRKSLSIQPVIHTCVIWQPRHTKLTYLPWWSMTCFSSWSFDWQIVLHLGFVALFWFWLFPCPTFISDLILSQTSLSRVILTLKLSELFLAFLILRRLNDSYRIVWLTSKPCSLSVVLDVDFILVQFYLIIGLILLSLAALTRILWIFSLFRLTLQGIRYLHKYNSKYD